MPLTRIEAENFTVFEKIAIPSYLQEAVYDSRFRKNLNGPFNSAEDAVASMLEDQLMYQIYEDTRIFQDLYFDVEDAN